MTTTKIDTEAHNIQEKIQRHKKLTKVVINKADSMTVLLLLLKPLTMTYIKD